MKLVTFKYLNLASLKHSHPFFYRDLMKRCFNETEYYSELTWFIETSPRGPYLRQFEESDIQENIFTKIVFIFSCLQYDDYSFGLLYFTKHSNLEQY